MGSDNKESEIEILDPEKFCKVCKVFGFKIQDSEKKLLNPNPGLKIQKVVLRILTLNPKKIANFAKFLDPKFEIQD